MSLLGINFLPKIQTFLAAVATAQLKGQTEPDYAGSLVHTMDSSSACSFYWGNMQTPHTPPRLPHIIQALCWWPQLFLQRIIPVQCWGSQCFCFRIYVYIVANSSGVLKNCWSPQTWKTSSLFHVTSYWDIFFCTEWQCLGRSTAESRESSGIFMWVPGGGLMVSVTKHQVMTWKPLSKIVSSFEHTHTHSRRLDVKVVLSPQCIEQW